MPTQSVTSVQSSDFSHLVVAQPETERRLSEASTENEDVEQEIAKLRPKKWKWVKHNLQAIVDYGLKEGILSEPGATYTNTNGAINGNAAPRDDGNDSVEIADKADVVVVKISNHDLSLTHAAIPFLPVPAAIFCFIANVVLPGSGTIVSGLCAMCMGQPRIDFKEGRIIMTVVVNFLVGIAQFGTITFLLVGWFWSLAWGGLLLMHSMQYREALIRLRQEAVATAAIEALTKDAILRRRDVRTLVTERKQEMVDNQNRKSSFFTARRFRRFSRVDDVSAA